MTVDIELLNRAVDKILAYRPPKPTKKKNKKKASTKRRKKRA